MKRVLPIVVSLVLALVVVRDARGNDIEAVITLADDQVEPDKKNDMVVGFAQPPADGECTLTAQEGITSKSGDSLAQDHVLRFEAAEPEPATSASASAPASAPAASSTVLASPASDGTFATLGKRHRKSY